MQNTSNLNALTYYDAYLDLTIILCIIAISTNIPWIIYSLINIFQNEKIVSRLVRNGIQNENINLVNSKRNKLLLHKYLLMNISFELLTNITTIVKCIMVCKPIKEITQFHLYNNDSLSVIYLYVKYAAWIVDKLFILCTIEMVNLTVLFVKDVYLRNSTHRGMRRNINRFLMRILLILCLGGSGIGLGIANILFEVFIIAQLVLYYRYSRQLYRSLGMYYQDVKYEFGDTSIEARTAGKHKRHYKWSAIWYFIIAICFMAGVTIFDFNVTLHFLKEGFIEQRLVQQNITFTQTKIFQNMNIISLSVSSSLLLLFWLLYLPIYTTFSLYYLCVKFLFVRTYRHRFHVNGRYEIESLVQPLIK